MGYTKSILIEGAVVGLSTLILGLVVRYIIANFENINPNFVFHNKGMWLSLFLTGFILHIGLDLIGLNRWYCKNCAGCK